MLADGCPVAVGRFPGSTADLWPRWPRRRSSNRVSVSSKSPAGDRGSDHPRRINNVPQALRDGPDQQPARASDRAARAGARPVPAVPVSTSAICSNSPASTSPASAWCPVAIPCWPRRVRRKRAELLAATGSRAGTAWPAAVTAARNPQRRGADRPARAVASIDRYHMA